MDKNIDKKVINTISEVNKEMKEKVLGYIMTAFGLVVGLAWNEAIKELINMLFPIDKNSIWAKFLYALLLTFLIIMITNYLFRKKEEVEK
jgi:tetrahydromethanopterin S-methyltransferase subunit G